MLMLLGLQFSKLWSQTKNSAEGAEVRFRSDLLDSPLREANLQLVELSCAYLNRLSHQKIPRMVDKTAAMSRLLAHTIHSGWCLDAGCCA